MRTLSTYQSEKLGLLKVTYLSQYDEVTKTREEIITRSSNRLVRMIDSHPIVRR